MKSKIVRGIINGGVLAAVAALGITVYQLGTKPIAENPQEENSVQVEETGLEEELSDGENAEDAAAAGEGWQDAAQDENSDGETGDEAGLSGVSEAGADGVTGSIRETAGSGTAENAAADADNGSGTEDRSVSAAAGADRSRTDGTGNTADNAGNTSAEGAVNNGAGASQIPQRPQLSELRHRLWILRRIPLWNGRSEERFLWITIWMKPYIIRLWISIV